MSTRNCVRTKIDECIVQYVLNAENWHYIKRRCDKMVARLTSMEYRTRDGATVIGINMHIFDEVHHADWRLFSKDNSLIHIIKGNMIKSSYCNNRCLPIITKKKIKMQLHYRKRWQPIRDWALLFMYSSWTTLIERDESRRRNMITIASSCSLHWRESNQHYGMK